MDIGNLGLFKVLGQKLDWLTQRQSVLAQNVANVDTPQYRPFDLEPFSFRAAMGAGASLATAQTNPLHLAGTLEKKPGMSKENKEKVPYEIKPGGNSVVLEEQMKKVGDTGTDFQLISNLYHKNLAMFGDVIGKSGS